MSQAYKIARLSRFVDSIRVKFKGGRGGDGCIAMHHEFANEFAGPGGGNGGHGGHVVLRAESSVKSLNGVLSSYTAKPGQRGEGNCQHGRQAEHTFVPVPIGTLVLPARPKLLEEHEFNPDESDILAELDEEGSMFIAARGGSGGRGNAEFLSDKNRHPKIAELGAHGDVTSYELRMRFYAHVALLGLPNVGKSTLLRTLTGARVKIGDYSFTTLFPQVGVLEYDDFRQVIISDLPGLVEESHKNRGLGLSFLRSLRRCYCLLYVIDMSQDPIVQFETLTKEIDSHDERMSKKPSLVLANKADRPDVEGNVQIFKDYLRKKRPELRVVVGSGHVGSGLSVLRDEIRRLTDSSEGCQE